MRPASYPYSSYDPRASVRSRAVAFVLALAITALIVFMLIELGAFSPPEKPEQPMVTLSLSQGTGTQPTKAKSAAKTKTVKTGGAPPAQAKAAKAPDIKPPPVPPPNPPWTVMYMSKEQMASADIANLPTHHADRSGAGGQGVQGSGAGRASGDDDGAGDGPGGQKLYNAEWYTRPTHAEMAFYLPKSGPREGWGMIACRTVPNYGVEDCQELGESPGSGLARAVRQAAWQFKVRPPRVNGTPQIGAWVRIRFDFSDKYASDGGD